MNKWVACRLLNASFIFNGIEYFKLHFCLCFMSSTYTRVVDFGHYFYQKSTLRLIRESTCTRVYAVGRLQL